jgi:CRP-like cAMP-binding protein
MCSTVNLTERKKNMSCHSATKAPHPRAEISKDLEVLIKQHPFLRGLHPRFVKLYDDCATVRRFASRQQLFHEGGEADHFYLILTGSVVLETFNPDQGMVTIQSIGPGQVLGWSWLFEPYKWHFTARTEAPTEVISLDAAALRAKAGRDMEFENDLLTRITRTVVQRLNATRFQLIDPTLTRSLEGRKTQVNTPKAPKTNPRPIEA